MKKLGGKELKMHFEEIVKEFEKENPEVVEAMRVFKLTYEQYHSIMESSPPEVVYVASLSTNSQNGDRKW